MIPIYLAFILALSIFLGFELISKVPATLHTPLMSGANAISGITLVGALMAAGADGPDGNPLATILGVVAVGFATVNVVGGYMVTDRMLGMFRRRDDQGTSSGQDQ
ncbi:MAG: NAD(P) transhydrogenase subunit alpha [Gammaproteobacteria bacterium]|nr:NAD(P) transhydrogenase subunit alpha [Gammaproteobacteria bacterium]